MGADKLNQHCGSTCVWSSFSNNYKSLWGNMALLFRDALNKAKKCFSRYTEVSEWL